MTALAELVDEFGEAIETDLSIYHGDRLRDFLTGRRPPGEALRKIRLLPRGCATHAQMLATPKKPSSGDYRSPKAEPWRSHYGWTREHELLADVFDAVLASAGGKKKPKPHPRTGNPSGAPKRGRPNAAKRAAGRTTR